MRPAKKRKESTPPIVFKFPDHDVDVRFKVFDDLEFHVHSVVLRMYSAFFRRFLDSPDKDGRDENTGKFKYEWATKYDADESWSLVDARSLTADQKNDKDYNAVPNKFLVQRVRKLHEMAFRNFIRVFYRESWTINNFEDLKLVMDMADYYCALPLISRSLHGAFFSSPDFDKEIFFSPGKIEAYLEVAVKLRSPEIFRECMICFVGNFREGFANHTGRLVTEIAYHPNLADPKLEDLAIQLHNQLCYKICATQCQLLYASQVPEQQKQKLGIEKQFLDKNRRRNIRERSKVSLPEYFQAFNEAPLATPNQVHLKSAVADILKNLLPFNKSLRAGSQASGDAYFFCSEITDQDLPWDMNENDW